MLLDQHRKFAGRSVDLEVLSAAEPDLLLTFASQVLNPKSGFPPNGETEAAVKVLNDETGAHLAKTESLCLGGPA